MNQTDSRRDRSQSPETSHGRAMLDLVIGGLVGTVVGGIVAVNLIIFAGTDRGYEAGIGELLAERPVVAAIALAILAISPIVGVVLANRKGSSRRGRTDHHRQAS